MKASGKSDGQSLALDQGVSTFGQVVQSLVGNRGFSGRAATATNLRTLIKGSVSLRSAIDQQNYGVYPRLSSRSRAELCKLWESEIDLLSMAIYRLTVELPEQGAERTSVVTLVAEIYSALEYTLNLFNANDYYSSRAVEPGQCSADLLAVSERLQRMKRQFQAVAVWDDIVAHWKTQRENPEESDAE